MKRIFLCSLMISCAACQPPPQTDYARSVEEDARKAQEKERGDQSRDVVEKAAIDLGHTLQRYAGSPFSASAKDFFGEYAEQTPRGNPQYAREFAQRNKGILSDELLENAIGFEREEDGIKSLVVVFGEDSFEMDIPALPFAKQEQLIRYLQDFVQLRRATNETGQALPYSWFLIREDTPIANLIVREVPGGGTRLNFTGNQTLRAASPEAQITLEDMTQAFKKGINAPMKEEALPPSTVEPLPPDQSLPPSHPYTPEELGLPDFSKPKPAPQKAIPPFELVDFECTSSENKSTVSVKIKHIVPYMHRLQVTAKFMDTDGNEVGRNSGTWAYLVFDNDATGEIWIDQPSASCAIVDISPID